MRGNLKAFFQTESGTVTKNIFYLGLVQGSNFILPLLAIPYLVRVLGDENYGIVLFAQSIAIYLVVLTDFGIDTYGTKEIALVRNNKKKLNEVFSALITLKGTLFLLSILLLVISFLNPKLYALRAPILLSLGIVVSNVLFPLWYFLGTEKMKIISILNISAKVVFTGLIFLFVQKQNDFDIALALHSFGYLVAGIISVFILKKLQVRLITPSWQQLVHHGKRSSWYFFSKLAGNIYTFSNVLILGLISPMASVGAAIADFGIAEKLFRAMQGMFDPIVKALYPNMVKNKDANLFKRFFLLFTTANIIGCLIVYFFSYQIMTFIYGQEPSSDSVYIFQLLLFAQTITVPSLLIGYPLLGSFGYGLAVNKSIIYAAAFHLSMIGALAYIGNFNELSLTYLLICTEFFLFSFRAIAVYRHRLW